MNSSDRQRRMLTCDSRRRWRLGTAAGEMLASCQETIGRAWCSLLLVSLLCIMASEALGNPDHQTPDTGNWLLGQWAREADGCRQPEFTFRADSATMFLEVDGEPTVFVYPAVRYEIRGSNITVLLGKRHPLAKTPGKSELSFQIRQGGVAFLQLLQGRVTPYRRCPTAESNT